MTNLTEQKIQRVLRFNYMTNPQYVAENLYVFRWESDFLFKTRSGYWHEVEIKISFSDFKNDAKNKGEKFEILEKCEYTYRGQTYKVKNRPNYFSYCVTEDIVDKVKDLIPEYAGLYYVEEKTQLLVKVKAPKKLHSEKIDDKSLKLTEKFYYNYRSWKRACERWYDEQENFNKERKFLIGQIKRIREKYKATTGVELNDIL